MPSAFLSIATEHLTLDTALDYGLIGLLLAFALLHLLLFFSYPRESGNFYYGLFALSAAANLFADHLQAYAAAEFIQLIAVITSVLGAASYIAFLFAVISDRVPLAVPAVGLFLTGLMLIGRITPQFEWAFWIARLLLIFFVTVTALVLAVRAFQRNIEGARLIGLVGLFALAVAAGLFNGYFPLFPAAVAVLINRTGFLGIIIFNSAFLARRFASTSKHLEAQLIEVNNLSREKLEQEQAAAQFKLQQEQERAKRALMEQELSLAAEIQRGLFPEKLPSIAGYEIAARNRPARLCGGDYYDAFTLEPGSGDGFGQPSYLLCVSDVAGKGLDAALLMSNMQATLHALAGRFPSLVELASQINQRLYESSPSNKFITAILLEIDPMTGEGRYVNAGHNPCLLIRRDGLFEFLESTGFPLGMMPSETLRMLGKQYEAKSLRLDMGDLVTLYSDGVPEAYDDREQEWGEERFQKCLQLVASESAAAIVNRIFAEIAEFTGSAPQHDDVTVLVLKRVAAY